MTAPYRGRITEVDNRNLALVAKLAGAPQDKAAGIEFFAKQGKSFEKNQTLYRIHAMNKSALDYSVSFAKKMTDIIKIAKD
jgi:thymidine phosphorylase